MRWRDLRTWEDCIAAATRLHDGVWPASSPVPSKPLCGCTQPEAQCVTLAIADKTTEGSWYCTQPSYIPALQGATDCDRRIYDWKPGHEPMRGHKDAKAPAIRSGSTAAILSWVEGALRHLMSTSGDVAIRIYAGSLLEDVDIPVSHDVMRRTGEALLVRLNAERPWKKGE